MPALDIGTTKGVCEIAYNGVRGERYRFPDGSTWSISEHRGDWTTGFKGIITSREGGGKKVLAFAGTDSLLDVMVDAAQVAGQLPPQYVQAIAWAQQFSAQESGQVVFAGHSLGGGLAAYCSVRTRDPACTVNPAPLIGGMTLRSLGSNAQITNYIARNEFVSSSPGRNPGTDVVVPSAGGTFSFFTDHSLSAVAPNIPLPRKIN
ncbi:MAG: DUF2974 domain-containing protein [Acidobacteria bacterium]|nr:MAG: DUF2974 domain-containing protein [Acidobacteriota bacterium]REJ99120.1 MAG: DUF2974 domain-containing protein [Acidobacteriota bacterium]REK16159.1 MAG: DUF2974 domain-containing protein [Acidobacteriota bacterium]REK43840.1 MAG: DUF2974 domain-containing protein [Acidobacteriota bacterium]